MTTVRNVLLCHLLSVLLSGCGDLDVPTMPPHEVPGFYTQAHEPPVRADYSNLPCIHYFNGFVEVICP